MRMERDGQMEGWAGRNEVETVGLSDVGRGRRRH